MRYLIKCLTRVNTNNFIKEFFWSSFSPYSLLFFGVCCLLKEALSFGALIELGACKKLSSPWKILDPFAAINDKVTNLFIRFTIISPNLPPLNYLNPQNHTLLIRPPGCGLSSFDGSNPLDWIFQAEHFFFIPIYT